MWGSDFSDMLAQIGGANRQPPPPVGIACRSLSGCNDALRSCFVVTRRSTCHNDGDDSVAAYFAVVYLKSRSHRVKALSRFVHVISLVSDRLSHPLILVDHLSSMSSAFIRAFSGQVTADENFSRTLQSLEIEVHVAPPFCSYERHK